MIWSARKSTQLTSRFENVAIHPTAEVAADVEIGPFTLIGPNCRIGPGNYIHNNVTLVANVDLGEGNEIYPGSVIGGLPQDKKYSGEESRVEIGRGNVIRENVTIHSGTRQGDGLTVIGDKTLIMAGCHIAHDCIIEDFVTIANNVLLGGHVKVERHAGFGGLAAVHHFVTIGQHAFVGGLTRVTQDAPPYMLVEGNPSRIWSVNKVGLKRRGFQRNTLEALKRAHRHFFRSNRRRSLVMQDLLKKYPDMAEIKILIEFLRATERGNHGRARQPLIQEMSED